ncbi:hypothetical protein PROFUN_12308 [Planoprotostelium fungivorum]|uniref:ATP-dependent RNA helicase n=1 Tax=Planoprotostelium fungivorum TaxID=1890364 RepID=A0A2P6N7V4_9EUKA|nr:hypothetical protein PROFUN_12308 [Planoprotostelium fungivorum]
MSSVNTKKRQKSPVEEVVQKTPTKKVKNDKPKDLSAKKAEKLLSMTDGKVPADAVELKHKDDKEKQNTVPSKKNKKASKKPEPEEEEVENDDQEIEQEEAEQEDDRDNQLEKDITKEQEATGDFTLTDDKFENLNISEKSKKALKELNFIKMTEIQSKSIQPLLEGKDLLGKAKTGSGKTLAFLVPAIERLYNQKFTPKKGVGAIVITPTRELALQIYGILSELTKYHTITTGLVMGGANRKTEQQKLIKGVNLIVGTPGRLLDHLHNTKGFVFDNLQMLIVDETDRILEIGFEEEIKQIIRLLPKERQTMLFSATQTQKVEDIIKLSLNPNPVNVGVEDNRQVATVENLEQGFVFCESDKRFLLLHTFLKKNKTKKIIVFFSSCLSVKYHAELLNYIDIPVMELHGKQKQGKRTQTFFEYVNAKTGILLCTDVAARGLDIPQVDWIIQFDPPDDPREYIHRVGRTARAGKSGRALLFLLPEEVGFLKYLRAAKVPVNEYNFPANKIANVQEQLEKIINKNYYLYKSARDGYRSYIQAYSSHSLKEIFDVQALDLAKVAKGFGFENPPTVTLSVEGGKSKQSRSKMKDMVKSKGFTKQNTGTFSASNPYGQKAEGDKRQFK